MRLLMKNIAPIYFCKAVSHILYFESISASLAGYHCWWVAIGSQLRRLAKLKILGHYLFFRFRIEDTGRPFEELENIYFTNGISENVS